MIEHGHGVAQVGLDAVQGRPLGMAVAAVVPADDAPAAGGEQRGEHVERLREVEATVSEHHGRRRLVTPLDHRDGHTVRVDRAPTVRANRSWERRIGRGGREIGGRHVGDSRGTSTPGVFSRSARATILSARVTFRGLH